jgi:hypothetical protein
VVVPIDCTGRKAQTAQPRHDGRADSGRAAAPGLKKSKKVKKSGKIKKSDKA